MFVGLRWYYLQSHTSWARTPFTRIRVSHWPRSWYGAAMQSDANQARHRSHHCFVSYHQPSSNVTWQGANNK
jgi:hypothetical protein